MISPIHKKIKPALSHIWSLAVIGTLTFSACKPEYKETQVDKVDIMAGSDQQCAFPQEKFPNPAKLHLMGPAKGFMPGSKGERKPVPGIKIVAKPAPGSDLLIEPSEAVSDAGGMVHFNVTAGRKLGDQYIHFIPENNPAKKTVLRFITGIKIDGIKQEPKANSFANEPLRVTIVDENSKPLEGVPVFFSLISAPRDSKSAQVRKKQVNTCEEGTAETELKVGEVTGVYRYSVEVSDPERNIHIRKIEVEQMGINRLMLVIIVLGGLAIFIFGMKNMSDGLQMVAGERMRTILQLFAKNRFVAIAAGALVTAVIQSSSATTVMVVGFVNAGLLNLFQSIGIVFGANIGTTITAQMIAFNLDQLALPAIILGLLMYMTSRKKTTKGWGQAFLGFGFLFYGMGIMGSELKLMKDFPTFINFFRHFDCSPVNGVMPFTSVIGAIAIGTTMTVLIQSSTATIAIALALAASGMINFYTAVPLILGDNIGTTITAFLASLGANKRAKQTAMAHILFNTLGCLYMTGLFYVKIPGTSTPVFLHIINAITPGDVFAEDPENIIRHIAMAHTCFNLFNVILFLPFIGSIAKLCNLVIPIKAEEKIALRYLEPNLLSAPAVAIEQTIQSIRFMSKEAWSMIKTATEDCLLPGKYSAELENNLAAREEQVDALQAEITNYLVKLTQRQLTEHQSELIPLLMHCTNDAERIADHTENIMHLAKRLTSAPIPFSADALAELKEIWEALGEEADSVIKALLSTDQTSISIALKKEGLVNKLTEKAEHNHIARLQAGKCEAMTGIIFIEILADLEKVGDHLSNIAERTMKMRMHHVELG